MLKKLIVISIYKTKKYISIPKVLYRKFIDVSDREAVYETVIIGLTLLVLLFSALDFFLATSVGYTSFVEIFDLFVCGIFALDLARRYKKTKGRISMSTFVKRNGIEIFAIIPLDVAFRAFRLVRLFRFAKLGRLSKIGRAGNLFLKFFNKFANPSYLRYKRFKTLIQAKGIKSQKK